MSDAADDLEAVRAEIDRIDGEIVDLVTERMRAAERVAEVKSREGKDIVDRDREEDVKSHYADAFEQAGLRPESGRGLAEYLIGLSIDREEKVQDES